MVAFSSSYGMSHAMNVQKGVTLMKLSNNKLGINCLRPTSVAFPVSSEKKCCRHRGLVVMNVSQSPGEFEGGVTATENSKEGCKDSGLEKRFTVLDHGKHIPGDNGGDICYGSNGNGKHTNGGDGGGGSGDGGRDGENDGNDNEEEEFGPIMNYEEVMRETKARGVSLPSDMLEAAKSEGIPRELLLRYLDLQGSVWPLGFAMKSFSMLRNRMLADPSFLFKVGTEVRKALHKEMDVDRIFL